MVLILKKWLVATRPWSIPASAAPVLVVVVWLYATGNDSRWELALPTILGAVLFQLAGNLISDYFDFTRGVDTAETAGSRMLPDGVFQPRTILLYGLTILTAASVLGIFLVVESGPFLFGFGIFGIVSTCFYYVLKFRGMGVFLIFAVYGPGIALGTEYTLTGNVSWPVSLISIPIGSLTTAILHVNDIRDMPHDKAAGIRTFALNVGRNRSEQIEVAMLVLPYLAVPVLITCRVLPATTLLAWLTFPMAWKIINSLRLSHQVPERINNLDQRTAVLQTFFSLSLVFAMILNIVIKGMI